MANVEQTEFTFPDEQDEKAKPVQQAEESSETQIEIVDDTPPADRGRKPMVEPPKDVTDDELSKYDEGVKKRIQHFTKGYHEERRAKESAQREKDEAIRIAQAVVEENKKLRGSLSEGRNALLEQAKQTVSGELAAAERNFRTAYESGDPEALLKAQQSLTAATIKADKLANFVPEPLQREETVVQTPPVSQPKPQIDAKLATWQDQNSWFGSNKKMTAYALGLHEELVESGARVGSDDYYKAIDKDMRERFPDQFAGEEVDTAVDAPPQRRSNVVAPATRSTAPKKVVLTKTQVNIAKRLGVPLELYARKVAEEMRK